MELAGSLHMLEILSDKVPMYLIPFGKATTWVSLFPACVTNLSPQLHEAAHHIPSASILHCKMDSINPEVKEVSNDQGRPEISSEDKIVSSYLENRSEIYRDLVKVQDDVSGSISFHSLAPLR